MINIQIQKKDLWLLAAIMIFLAGVAYVIAYNPSGTGGNPAIMGHSVDEIDWSKAIPNLYVNGNVGIGTTSPSQKLDVNGTFRLQPSSTPIAANGVMYYDSGTNRFRCYQNGVWADCIGTGAGSQNVFTTIDAPTGTDPVADSPTDTLTLLAGSGITITGDAALDRIIVGFSGEPTVADATLITIADELTCHGMRGGASLKIHDPAVADATLITIADELTCHGTCATGGFSF